MKKLEIVDCEKYVEDPYICYYGGEPKGQCLYCGSKWYEHRLELLSPADVYSAVMMRNEYGLSDNIIKISEI